MQKERGLGTEMRKIGILTFHYSNNYGGVLQTVALQNTVKSMGYDAEIIHFIPKSYRPINTVDYLSLVKNIIKGRPDDPNIFNTIKKILIVKIHSNNIMLKFNSFKAREMKLSRRVDDDSIRAILDGYDLIVVGSDQVWNPSQRIRPEYFLNYGDEFKVNRISYAADSTIKEVEPEVVDSLRTALSRFCYISVRNEHSFEFVKAVTGKESEIVADPTILYEFQNTTTKNDKEYILAYVIGKEINGTHVKALEKIKQTYGALPVYSIKVPDMKAEPSGYADKVMYELGPEEWMNMLRNAKFVYTDSYHGVIFSLKYHTPFLAYYTEELRATRFLDIGKRYNIEKYIVKSVEEIDLKESLKKEPDFSLTDAVFKKQKEYSLEFLKKALKEFNEV